MSQYIQDFISGKPFGDGTDGVYNSAGNATDAPVDASCAGVATETHLHATNAGFAAGQLILIHQSRGTGVGQWEVNKISAYNAGQIDLTTALAYTYTDSGASQAQVIKVPMYSSFTQGSGHTLTAKAWDGDVGGIITFACNGTTTITGSIVGSGKGFVLGAGSNGDAGATSGEGTVGSGVTDNSRNANGNGGGGASKTNTSKEGGGGGANGTAGSNGSSGTYGYGATSTNSATSLTTIWFGGGGGGGHSQDIGGAGKNGGNGGGIVIIFSKEITITGTIVTSGNDGTGGGANDGGGGGGAGGSVLLKAQIATLGSTKITSSVGSGGSAGGNGGNGGAGIIHLDYGSSYTGTTTPTLDVTQDTTLIEAIANNYSFFM